MCKCNLIYAHKKNRVFSVLFFTNSWSANSNVCRCIISNLTQIRKQMHKGHTDIHLQRSGLHCAKFHKTYSHRKKIMNISCTECYKNPTKKCRWYRQNLFIPLSKTWLLLHWFHETNYSTTLSGCLLYWLTQTSQGSGKYGGKKIYLCG